MLKEKCSGKSRQNEEHRQNLRKIKMQGERNNQEHKISVGSQIKWTRQSKRTSRRKKQHFKRKERKQREESIQKLHTKERADIANRTWCKEASVINRIETVYGFVADYSKIKRHNASLYLASMRSCNYFDRPKNLAFYDLCTELEPPQNLRSLLGL